MKLSFRRKSCYTDGAYDVTAAARYMLRALSEIVLVRFVFRHYFVYRRGSVEHSEQTRWLLGPVVLSF